MARLDAKPKVELSLRGKKKQYKSSSERTLLFILGLFLGFALFFMSIFVGIGQ